MGPLMTKSNKPTSTNQIIDVAHPGKSAPAGNSKSVIVSNRPLLRDPMVVSDTTAADRATSNSKSETILAKTSNKSNRLLTAPLLETEEAPAADQTTKPDEAKPDIETSQAVEPAPVPDEPNLPDATTDVGVDKQPAKPVTSPENNLHPSDPEEPPADEAQPSKEEAAKQLEAEDSEEAKRQAAIDKLADSKQYYLPINSVEKRRSKRFVLVGVVLSLLLIVAWADIALDAGLIHIGNVKSPTHFFSN